MRLCEAECVIYGTTLYQGLRQGYQRRNLKVNSNSATIYSIMNFLG